MRKALKTVLCVALVLALAVVIALRVLPPMNTPAQSAAATPIPVVTQSVHISIHVAVAAGTGVRRVALFRAGRRGHNSSVTVLMRLDAFESCIGA